MDGLVTNCAAESALGASPRVSVVIHNPGMPNLVTVLKAEVSRLARKELRSETEGLKKIVASQRSDIAALKRRTQELEKALKALARTTKPARAAKTPAETPDAASPLRFRAAGMANNRKRLGLSAADFGLLVGATGQSIYAWESGKAKPRAENLAAIAALRGIGKREVVERLARARQT